MKEGSRIKTKPNILWSENASDEAPENKARSDPHHGQNGSKLTLWTPSQFLAYEDDAQDILLSNGYIEKGSPCVFCGPPGIGKSRLILQLAIKSILGQGFLGWDTNAAGLTWLILQNENGNGRIKADYTAMLKNLTSVQLTLLDKHLIVHALVSDMDGHLDLNDPDARKRVIEAISDIKPDIVVGDPLSSLSLNDLDKDVGMLSVARDFGRIVRKGNVKAVPLLVQHARTGKEAQQGMSGSNRASYARNSKALYGWTRSQWNLAAVEEKKNDRLYIASGKCNNAAEFDEFIVQLDLETRYYAKTTEDADEVRKTRASEDDSKVGGRPKKLCPDDLKGFLATVTPLPMDQVRLAVCRKLKISTKTFKRTWDDAIELQLIEETKDHKWLWKG